MIVLIGMKTAAGRQRLCVVHGGMGGMGMCTFDPLHTCVYRVQKQL